MRIWEVARRPRLVVRDLNLPLTVVRAEARKSEERLIPVLKSVLEDRVLGYLTPIELILPTSHHTTIRVRDALREYPIITQDMTLDQVYEEFIKHKTIGAPVVDRIDTMKLIGVVTFRELLDYMIKSGYKPLAESVAEVMTTKDLDKYIVTFRERVNRVWSRIAFHGQPGVVVVRSHEEPIPMGIVTYHDFIEHGRWLFHRESEHHITTPAKVQRIMTRGTLVATKDMPIEAVARVVAEHDIPIIPVIDENGHVIGVLTQADLVRAYLEGAKPGRVPVAITKKMPIPVAAAERVSFVSGKHIMAQVVVERRIEKAEKPLYSGITAGEIIVEELPAITINDTVEHARKEMLRRKTDYLLVIDEKGEVVGVVSKWNMLKALGLKGPLWRRRVRDRYFIDYIMTKNLPRVTIRDPLEIVALRMVSSEAEVVSVVDDNGEVIGYITKDDVVRAASNIMYDLRAENLIFPGKTASVHPFHSLYHVVNKMKMLYLDALTVYDGSRVVGVVSANRLPFIALEDSVTGIRSRRLLWVRKLVKGAARKGRYVKITPLLAMDVMVPYRKHIAPDTAVKAAIEMMFKERLNGIPVLSEDRQIVSVISKNDILRELARRALRAAKIEKKIEVETAAE